MFTFDKSTLLEEGELSFTPGKLVGWIKVFPIGQVLLELDQDGFTHGQIHFFNSRYAPPTEEEAREMLSFLAKKQDGILDRFTLANGILRVEWTSQGNGAVLLEVDGARADEPVKMVTLGTSLIGEPSMGPSRGQPTWEGADFLDQPATRRRFQMVRDQWGGWKQGLPDKDPEIDIPVPTGGADSKGRAQADDKIETRGPTLGLPDSRTVKYNNPDGSQSAQTKGRHTVGVQKQATPATLEAPPLNKPKPVITTSPGRYMISPQGQMYAIEPYARHELFMQRALGKDLEEALNGGWVRVGINVDEYGAPGESQTYFHTNSLSSLDLPVIGTIAKAAQGIIMVDCRPSIDFVSFSSSKFRASGESLSDYAQYVNDKESVAASLSKQDTPDPFISASAYQEMMKATASEKEEFFEQRTLAHIERVQNAVKKIVTEFPEYAEALETVKGHDASKLQEPERTPYIDISWRHKFDNFKGYKNPGTLPDKSENEATLHHVTTNPHHPEYWLEDKSKANIDPKDRNKSLEVVDASQMSDEAIVEMVADWQAMSEELKQNTAREWYNKQKDVRWHFSDEQDKLIDKLLAVFEKGNNETEAVMKNTKNLLAFIRKDAELFKKVLLDAYIRLHQAYPNDPNARNQQLIAAFPDDKKAVEDFLANTGNLPESVHEVSKSASQHREAVGFGPAKGRLDEVVNNLVEVINSHSTDKNEARAFSTQALEYVIREVSKEFEKADVSPAPLSTRAIDKERGRKYLASIIVEDVRSGAIAVNVLGEYLRLLGEDVREMLKGPLIEDSATPTKEMEIEPEVWASKKVISELETLAKLADKLGNQDLKNRATELLQSTKETK